MLTFLIHVLFLLWIRPVAAQLQDQRWSEPVRISSDEGSIASGGNMVADPYGRLHLFWIETGLPGAWMVIQYSLFDGKSWSEPLDIYATRGYIVSLSATIADDAMLHLAWNQGNTGPVYFASAPAANSLSAHNWTQTSVLYVPASTLALRVDTAKTFHLLYGNFYGDNPGIYYTYSTDGGANWGYSELLDPDRPPMYMPKNMQLLLDDHDGLHAIWEYGDLESPGFIARWVRYAYSRDGGISWSLPTTIAEDKENSGELRAAAPVATVSEQTVHIVYAGDAETHRKHIFSTDAGDSWLQPTHVFGQLLGQAGDGITIDGVGRVHYFAQIRYPQGLYHMTWDGVNWTHPTLVYLVRNNPFEEFDSRIHAHSVQAAANAGNQIVVTFADPPTTLPRGLYAIHRILEDMPASPLEPILLPTPTPLPTRPLVAERGATPERVLAREGLPFASAVEDVRSTSATLGQVLLLSIVLPVLLLGVVLLDRIRHMK